MERAYIVLGYLVRKARVDQGMSVEELAKRVDAGASSIRSLEIGKQRTPFHKIIKIVNILDIDLNDIRNV